MAPESRQQLDSEGTSPRKGQRNGPSRRTVLVAGGTGLMALGVARGLLDDSTSAAAPIPAPTAPTPPSASAPHTVAVSGTAGPSPGSVATIDTTTGWFDLSRPARPVLLRVRLHEKGRAMQGIAYDTVNRRLFVTQLRDRRPGADLCINQLGRSARVLAHVHVNRAGHGQSFGVEPVGSVSYLWLECDADENSSAGRGRALARFAFRPGKRPVAKKFFDDGVEVGCAIDPVNRRILIRRPEGGRTMFSLYELNRGTPGTEPVARFAEPAAVYPRGAARVLQSFTAVGRYAYVFIGTGGHAGTRGDPFDSYLSRIDMRTGEVVQQVLITAGRSLVFREPEGMAVNVVGGVPQLVFGFASRPRMRSPRRYANLYAIDAWR